MVSLLSGIYQLIVMVLVNHLKPLLDLLVSELHGACVGDRQIQDIGHIANKLLDSKRLKKQASLIFKLDFYKAFDCVG